MSLLSIRTIRDKNLIKESEGLSLVAYLPTPNDVPTIGWGHTSDVHMGQTITLAQAEVYLTADLKWVEAAILGSIKVPLNQNQFDALAGLIFNIGAPRFNKSTVRRKLNGRDYLGAANAFLMWNKQRNDNTGKLEVLKGLTIRRNKERTLFLK
jgi:lysozyme